MNFTSQICTTKEQSERLLALGLKKETADMAYQCIGVSPYEVWDKTEISDDLFPAWSLHRLLCLIPKEYRYDIDASQLFVNAMICSDPYTETIELIRLLLEDGYIYDEYLNA